jgi:hypothetical protein
VLERRERSAIHSLFVFLNNLINNRIYMKYLILAILMLLFLSSGCSQKSGLFAPDLLEEKALSATRKGEIYNSLEIKASLVATYLNPVLKSYNADEKASFLVSVFIDDDYSDPKKQGLFNPDYLLTLNGKKATEIRPLKLDDDLVKIAPVKNMWSHYYLVTFPKTSSEKLMMRFESQRYGASILNFSGE